jgi:hypothetical protein
MKKHPTHEIAGQLLGEMLGAAKDVSRALAPPSKDSGGQDVKHAQFIQMVREGYHTEGAPYLVRLRDQLAPVAISTPAGQLRAKTGLDNFNAAIEEALPELFALATIEHDDPIAALPEPSQAPNPAAPYVPSPGGV